MILRHIRGKLRRALAAALPMAVVMLMLASSGWAQEARGSIQGRVMDPSGAVVPGTDVTVTNVATGVVLKSSSNQEGAYSFLFLVSGSYTMNASARGFKNLRRENIVVQVNDRLQVDLRLELGAAAEVVRVAAEAPLLQTATANLGQVVNARLVSELPTPHGSPYSLLTLAPGVLMTFLQDNNLQPNSTSSQTSRMSIQGSPKGTAEFTMDGAPSTQFSHRSGTPGSGGIASPPADIVEEFKVETGYDASIGHSSGPVVNISLKSGGNQPHGSVYYFHRSPEWNANSWFGNRTGQPRSTFNYKRWGGSFTGPVYLPKLYDGRNKTFYSYGYEGLDYAAPRSLVTTVPFPAQKKGDFSQLLALGGTYQIYDPLNSTAEAGGLFRRAPIPGNIIPPSRINPIASKIFSYYPDPLNADRPDGLNNFTRANFPDPQKYAQHIFRFDHNLSDKQRIFGRYLDSRSNTGPFRKYFENVTHGSYVIVNTWQATLDDVYTVSPNLVLNARYNMTRFGDNRTYDYVGFDPKELGFGESTLQHLTSGGKVFPSITSSPLFNLAGGGPAYDYSDHHSGFFSLNKLAGSHNLKMGMDARLYRRTIWNSNFPSGAFDFNCAAGRGPLTTAACSPSGLGQGMAAGLLGIAWSGSISRTDSEALATTYWSLYLHDNWQVSPKLTFDLGLRWEYEGPMTERFNRSVRGFDLGVVQKIDAAARAAYAQRPDASLPASLFRLSGGLLFAGRAGVSRGLWDRSYTRFQPRAGFAYKLLPKVVLRGGFGVFHIQEGVTAQRASIQTGFGTSTAMITTQNGGGTFIADINNPFPSGLDRALGASQGVETFLGRGISFHNPLPGNPYAMRASLNVQTLLPNQILLEVGYAGSRAIRLPLSRNINALGLQYFSTSPERDNQTISYLSANVPNPMVGLLPGTSLNGATISRAQLLLPFPHFGSISTNVPQGFAWYNSLQTRIERRFGNGLTFQVAHTWSKNMEALRYLNGADPVPYRMLSADDRPLNLAVSGIFELPFGKGKRLLASGRLLNYLVGGWQAGIIYQYVSGSPYGFSNVIFTGDVRNIPLSSDKRSVDRWFNVDAGFERNSARQLQSNVVTWPPLFNALRMNAWNNWDLSALKRVTLSDRYSFELRCEVLNAMNHASAFNAPDTNPASSAFGRVTSLSTQPRNLQLGLKFKF
jgi:hypothetical protein